MQAVILAGGKGTRLRPFTTALPKPLVPVGRTAIIEVILRQLKRQGFRDVVISTGHLAELIEAYCGNGKKWGLRIRYAREDKPLSTAGALRLIGGLKPRFLTVNGDVLTTMNFRKLMDEHARKKAAATVAVVERKTTLRFGVIKLDRDGKVASYTEKPAQKHLVSMGVNVFDRRVVSRIKKNEFLGIPEFIERLRGAGEPVHGFVSRAEWLDIGRPDDYQTAQDIFESSKRRARYFR